MRIIITLWSNPSSNRSLPSMLAYSSLLNIRRLDFQGCFNSTRTPLFTNSAPVFFHSKKYYWPTVLSNSSSSSAERQLTSPTCLNIISIIVTTAAIVRTHIVRMCNNYTVAHDRSELIASLSPLGPGLWHWEIQKRRVDNSRRMARTNWRIQKVVLVEWGRWKW